MGRVSKIICAIIKTLLQALWSILKRPFTPRDGQPERWPNENGYYVLANGELEHRYLAQQVLGRSLATDEIVHHINGRKTDNRIENLCVMNWEEHEIFHAWLHWKKGKSGSYPTPSMQRDRLENRHGGILLGGHG